jgi:DNA-binding CsgD family transcriptional regulator
MGQRGRPRSPGLLTPREQEVLDLIRAGRTNADIGEALGISVETVKQHVSQVLAKLGVSNREEAAAWGGEERPFSLWRLLLALGGLSVVAAAIAGLGLLVWGVSQSGEPEATLAPSGTPSAGANVPSGVIDFARQIDSALSAANTGFFSKSIEFQNWDCGGLAFPAGGPGCAQVATGGTPAVVVGAYASEGAVYDGPSFALFMSDWTRNVDTGGAFDSYGKPLPRVEAIAKAIPQSIGADPGQDIYAVIATKITPSAAPNPGGREVLTFFVPANADPPVISFIERSPVSFLDSQSAESQGEFSSWTRWLDIIAPHEPTPTYAPGTGWTSPVSLRKVAFIDNNDVLRVANSDGSDRRQLAENACSGHWQFSSVSWSPLGDRIGVLCPPAAFPEATFDVYSAEDGSPIGSVEGVYDYRWSPDGTRIAYQTASAGSDPPPQVRIAGVGSGGDTLVADDAVLLDWAADGRIIIGQNPGAGDQPRYKAAWYDPASGQTTPAPEFDNGVPFWIAGDGKTAVLADSPPDAKSGARALAVLNLSSGARTPINGGINYPSIAFPGNAVAINWYEAANQFFWASSPDGVTLTVSSADLGGARVTDLGRFNGGLTDLSWDGLLLYRDQTRGMVIRELVTGAETVFPDAVTGAIRPPQPDDPRH